jgi:hypothetical protein
MFDDGSPRKSAVEVMAQGLKWAEELARVYKPNEPGEPPNPNANEREYKKWSNLEAQIRRNLARYLPPAARPKAR